MSWHKWDRCHSGRCRSRSVDSYAKMTYRTARADQSAWNIGTPTSILGDQDIRAALSNDTGLFKDSS